MKKLIALAVAAAAAPAFAAVSISGTTEVSYSDKATTTLATEKVSLGVSASGELDNGMTVSTGVTLWNSGDSVNNDGGEGSITIAGAFGSLSVGDVAGPLDALDGVAVATPENDLSNGQGADMGLRYDLPAFVDGLTLHVGYAAETASDAGQLNDATGFGASFAMGGFKVFAGTESYTVSTTTGVSYSLNTTTGAIVADTSSAVTTSQDGDTTGYGVAYSMGGFTVGYNSSTKEVGTAETNMAGFSAGYSAGNFAVAINTSETDNEAGVVSSDKSSVGASYNLGGGVKVYAVTTSDDKKPADDEDTVGISFSF